MRDGRYGSTAAISVRQSSPWPFSRFNLDCWLSGLPMIAMSERSGRFTNRHARTRDIRWARHTGRPTTRRGGLTVTSIASDKSMSARRLPARYSQAPHSAPPWVTRQVVLTEVLSTLKSPRCVGRNLGALFRLSSLPPSKLQQVELRLCSPHPGSTFRGIAQTGRIC